MLYNIRAIVACICVLVTHWENEFLGLIRTWWRVSDFIITAVTQGHTDIKCSIPKFDSDSKSNGIKEPPNQNTPTPTIIRLFLLRLMEIFMKFTMLKPNLSPVEFIFLSMANQCLLMSSENTLLCKSNKVSEKKMFHIFKYLSCEMSFASCRCLRGQWCINSFLGMNKRRDFISEGVYP